VKFLTKFGILADHAPTPLPIFTKHPILFHGTYWKILGEGFSRFGKIFQLTHLPPFLHREWVADVAENQNFTKHGNIFHGTYWKILGEGFSPNW
jgi:hypothetical protein